MATGGTSAVAVCGLELELDLMAIPTPNAAANPNTAATAALSGAALLNLNVSQLRVGAVQVRATAVVAAGPVAVGDRGHLLVRAVADRVQDRADARARPSPFALEELRGLFGRTDRVAERLVEGDPPRAAVEIPDVQPVEVRSRLAS